MKWQAEIGVQPSEAPAIGAGGLLYVGSKDGYLYAISKADGALAWQLQMNQPVQSRVTIGVDGTLFVGTGGVETGGGVVSLVP